MIRLTLVLLFCLLPPPAASAADREAGTAPKTIIRDQKEAALLLGRHSFTTASLGLYCSTRECLGDSIIYEISGRYYFYGGHIKFYEAKDFTTWGGGYIHLNGIITEIHTEGFTFEGTIETGRLDRNTWYPCMNKGRFEFTRDHDNENRLDHKADFWRLYHKDEPEGCEIHGDTSYVDMFVENLGYN